MSFVRRDCAYYLRYGGRDMCKLPWYKGDITSPPEDLTLRPGGCEDCEDFAETLPHTFAPPKGEEDPCAG